MDTHGTDIHGTDIHGTDMHGTDMYGTDMHGTDMHRTDMMPAVIALTNFGWWTNFKLIALAANRGQLSQVYYFILNPAP